MPLINSKVIEKTRAINCPLGTTWWKWSTHEGLLTFFGSGNKVELRPGGPYEIFFLMDNPPGLRGGEGNKILSFVPSEMLSFTWNAPPEFPEIRDHTHKTWVVVDFKSTENNKTMVKIRHLGWLDGEHWDDVFHYFENAWTIVLDWLEESCK